MKPVTEKTVIYSASPIMMVALKTLCRSDRKQKTEIICVYDPDKLTDVLSAGEIQCAVLDVMAHRHASWLNQLRLYFPAVSFIITQRQILFSDRVLAEYLGMTWLRTYDAILAAWPEFRLTDVVINEIFSGPEAGVPQVTEGTVMPQAVFCDAVNKRLRNRLLGIFTGCPVTTVILDGIIKGVPVNTLGERIFLSRETVYQYRKKIIRALQIEHRGREFMRSLKIDNSAQ